MGIPFEKWYEIVEGVKETTNPFERNAKKEGIESRLKERGLDADKIKFNENYDDGSYVGGKIDSKEIIKNKEEVYEGLS